MLTALLTLSVVWAELPSRGPEVEPIVIRATGIGRSPRRYDGARARLMAERAAQVVAVRNLLAEVQSREADGAGISAGVREAARTSVAAGPTWSPVEGWVRGHRYLPTVFLDDGTAVVTVELVVSPAMETARAFP